MYNLESFYDSVFIPNLTEPPSHKHEYGGQYSKSRRDVTDDGWHRGQNGSIL